MEALGKKMEKSIYSQPIAQREGMMDSLNSADFTLIKGSVLILMEAEWVMESVHRISTRTLPGTPLCRQMLCPLFV